MLTSLVLGRLHQRSGVALPTGGRADPAVGNEALNVGVIARGTAGGREPVVLYSAFTRRPAAEGKLLLRVYLPRPVVGHRVACLLYTSDAADE